jgi:hypothetical protein
MGLVRMAARTAVVAGTATAVSGRVARRQNEKYAAQDQAAYDQQMAAQQAAAAAPTVVDAAKTASEIDVDNMRNVMEGLQGYGTAPAA